MATKSYLSEMIEKRKVFLEELRETDAESYLKTLMNNLDTTVKNLGMVKQPKPDSALTLVQEKIFSAIKQQITGSKRDDTDKAHTDKKFHDEEIGELSQLKSIFQVSSDETKKQLELVVLQLKKLNKTIGANSGNSLVDDALDLFGGKDKKGGSKARTRKGGKAGKGGFFSSAKDKIDDVLEAGKGKLGGLAESAKGKAGGVLGKIGSFAEGVGGKVLPKLGTGLAVAAGTYAIGSELASDRPAEEKATNIAKESTKIAGGFLGAEGGAAIGATIGTFIAPVIGTAIGGAIGGIVGGVGGSKLVEGISNTISEAVEGSRFSDVIGKAAAVAMTPFSEEARQALIDDYKHTIAPELEKSFTGIQNTMDGWSVDFQTFKDKLSDYTEVIASGGTRIYEVVQKGSKDLLESIDKTADNAFSSVGSALGQVVSGFKSGGFSGGLAAAKQVGSNVMDSAGKGLGKIGQAAKNIASGIPESIKGIGKDLGAVSAKYESGNRGVGTVSSGAGDAGGVSYGAHQLSSKTGSMSKFLASEEAKPFAEKFAGLRPGSSEFNAAYKSLAGSKGEDFAKAQHDYITRTHFDPLAAKTQNDLGFDISKADRGFKEAVYSTSVQYGAGTNVINKAFEGKDINKMSPEERIATLQDYKAATVGSYFKSSSADVQQSVADRAQREKKTLMAVNQQEKALGQVDKGKEVANEKPLGTPAAQPTALGSVAKAPEAVQVSSGQVTGKASPAPIVTSANYSTTTNVSNDNAGGAVVTGKASPIPMASPSLPPEKSYVVATNLPPQAPAPAQAPGQNGSTQVASQSASIELGEIPLRIDDFGIVLLNIGHTAIAAVAIGLTTLVSFASSVVPFVS
jgi:hypothetical protein